MSQSQPDFGIDDTNATDRAHSELEIYDKIIAAGASEDFWGDVLLSTGVYEDKEYWQQVDAYLDGLFAEAAFGTKLPKRTRAETKLALAKHGFHGADELTEALLPADWGVLDETEQEQLLDLVEKMHPDKEHASAIHRGWHDLDGEERAAELERLTGTKVSADAADAYRRRYLRERGDEIWQKLSTEARTLALMEHAADVQAGNAFWRMVAFRHDASGSKGARIVDNIFRRVTEQEVTADEKEDARRVLGLGGSV